MPRPKSVVILCLCTVIIYLLLSADESDKLQKLRTENEALREKLALGRFFNTTATEDERPLYWSGMRYWTLRAFYHLNMIEFSEQVPIKFVTRIYQLKLYNPSPKNGNRTTFADSEFMKKMIIMKSKCAPDFNSTGLWRWEIFPKSQLFWKIEAEWLPDRVIFKSIQMLMRRKNSQKKKKLRRYGKPTGPERDSGKYLGDEEVSLDTSNLHL